MKNHTCVSFGVELYIFRCKNSSTLFLFHIGRGGQVLKRRKIQGGSLKEAKRVEKHFGARWAPRGATGAPHVSDVKLSILEPQARPGAPPGPHPEAMRFD